MGPYQPGYVFVIGGEATNECVVELMGETHFIGDGTFCIQIWLPEQGLSHRHIVLRIFIEVLIFRILEEMTIGKMNLGAIRNGVSDTQSWTDLAAGPSSREDCIQEGIIAIGCISIHVIIA